MSSCLSSYSPRPTARKATALLLGGWLFALTSMGNATPPAPGTVALDFDDLERRAPETRADLPVKPPLPQVPEELAGGNWAALPLPRGQGYIQPYPRCSKGKECTLGLAYLVKQGKSFTVKAKLGLPPLPPTGELEYLAPLALFDSDGDGKDELLVRYDGRRPGSGVHKIKWLAIVNIPAMTLALLHELESSGDSRTDAACGFDVYRLDLNGDGRQDLRFVRACTCPKKVPNCPRSPDLIEEFLATPDHRFSLRTPASAPIPRTPTQP